MQLLFPISLTRVSRGAQRRAYVRRISAIRGSSWADALLWAKAGNQVDPRQRGAGPMNCRGAPQVRHAREVVASGRWPLRSSLQLGALPTATPCARLHARHVLHEWGITGIADTAELLVSELVTNGVKAAQLLEQKPPVWLRLSTDNVRLLIEVWDGNTQPPRPGQLENGLPPPEIEGGRGLFLVETLSSRWSWGLTEEPRGKVVWCELDGHETPDQEAGDAVTRATLPRRVPVARQVRAVRAMDDPTTLRRVHNGLRRMDLIVTPRLMYDGVL
jgi:anti-sigma regulatory factor (Ser/Thr protein kinase)